MKAQVKIKMMLMNPYNSKIPAAYLICDSNLTMEVTKNSANMSVKLKNITLVIENFKALFRASETIEDIRKKVTTILPIAQSAINNAFQQGIALPKFIDEFSVLKPSYIHLEDGFAIVECDFKDNPTNTTASP